MLSATSSLSEVRAFIAEVAGTLDPHSRYISELLDLVGAARDTADLLERLAAESRGMRFAGRAVFDTMSIEDKLRCNLITNETVLFRFSEGEWGALLTLLASHRGVKLSVLSAPCSHGEEAYSIAAACLRAGVPFSIDARDIQKACVDEARTGRLTMGFPDEYLDTPAVVSKRLLEHIDFQVGDLLVEPSSATGVGAGPWDLIICRNFLGYFVEPLATQVAVALARRLTAGGALFVDSFCLGKFPGLSAALEATGARRQGHTPVFVRPAAS